MTTAWVFFFGSLRDEACRDVVLGRPSVATPAVWPGWRVVWDARGESPVALPGDGQAEGVLVEVGAEELARLDFYEVGYDRRPATVRIGRDGSGGETRALVYHMDDGARASDEPWTLQAWRARWGGVMLTAARDAMALYGQVDAQEMDRRWPMMLARGWAERVAAAEDAPAALRRGRTRDEVVRHERTRLQRSFFAFDRARLTHPTFDGGTGTITREVLVVGEAALVLPYDPATDRVLLIEQFRVGPYLRGDRRPWPLEPVAGLVDPLEDPAETARRETREEAGIDLAELIPVARGYPSPGTSTEHYHLFVGIADLSGEGGRTGGLETEGEDILTHVLPLDDALALIASGEIAVVPLMTLLYWAALNRGRLGGRPGAG